ncbi:MAG: enoyl-ACP reductase [Anaerolineae bacterium]|jgi:enoyl-[acyl-carrier protein] reductase I|nr:enoyl-ACP reductase [Anaerolineae bacterium]
MGLLDGKVALIFGVANKNSIAWGVTKAFADAGATICLNYGGEPLKRRVEPLAAEVNCSVLEECDVQKDDHLDNIFQQVQAKHGKLDILVHSVAFARREDLGGRFIDISREGFAQSMDISAYSLVAMAKRAEPLMTAGGSIMSMTYYAAEKVIPDYNAMAVCKAALEIMTKYLAADMGFKGIRVNAISAGPIKTLAAAGIPGFRDLLRHFDMVAPLRNSVTPEEVGQAALFLASDMAKMITGEIMHVDAGYNVLGMTAPREELKPKDEA